MAKRRKKETEEPLTPAQPVAPVPQDGSDKSFAPPDPDRVAFRAYELFVERGCRDGQALDDWLTAERELSSDTRRSTD